MFVKNEMGAMIDYETAVQHMDNEVRENVHNELAPCSEQEFFNEYCKQHRQKFGEEFFLNEENPVY